MSDSPGPEPIPKRPPPPTPGKPIPRISKTAPLTSEEAEAQEREAEGALPERAKPAKKKLKAEKPKGSDGERKKEKKEKKGVLLEETPSLDTYESRRTIRIAVGIGLAVVLGLIVLGISRAFRSSEPETLPPEEGSGSVAGLRPPSIDTEKEARTLLADARRYAEQDKTKLVEDRLKKVLASYPKSSAAKEAQEALDRRKQGMPYFLDGPAVVAVPPEAPPAEPAPPPIFLKENRPPEPKKAELTIQPPPQPPEPRRPTGLAMETSNVAPRPLPAGFRARAEAGVHPSGWPLEITCDRDGSSMVLVPGGTFTMGRNDGPENEGPAHKVTLSSYYIDQHEVTARLYALFQEKTDPKSRPAPAAPTDGSPPPPDDRPAVRVSFPEAQAYAEWAGKRIPTEAQWEMAARTIDGRPFPWGASPPAWDKPREPRQIDPVMSFPNDLSPYAVFDLAGNAWEWTSDFYQKRHTADPAVNPTGPASPSRGGRRATRVIKGGSKTWDASFRTPLEESVRYPYLGFRCVLPLDDAPPPAPPDPGQPAQQGGGQRPAGGNKVNVPF
jgi:formylglycine-generating enzyme required for sulfatase activity